MWIAFALLLLLLLAYLAHEHWPRMPGDLYIFRLHRLLDSMRGRGLTFAEQQDELSFRHAMARVRRLASDAALKSPGGTDDVIDQIVADETKAIATRDRKLALRFANALRDTPLSEILYRDAYRAVKRYRRKRPMNLRPTPDEIAAVTTL